MTWRDGCAFVLLIAIGLAGSELWSRRLKSAGGIRSEGARPYDYRPAHVRQGSAPAWADALTENLYRCLQEGRAGGVADPPCRFSCTELEGEGEAAHFLEAWSTPMPLEACEAWPKPEGYRP